MQATLDASSLKAFTKALGCLSKYGDELSILATEDALTLSATNASKSAYCRIKYHSQFFSRYRVGSQDTIWGNETQTPSVTGQLMIKSLLAVLRNKTGDKSVERCEITIVEPVAAHEEEEETEDDSLESRLVLRLFCKHGVVKTHRISLLTAITVLAPGPSNPHEESRITIGPKALRDLIDHFPVSKSAKADPQLVWVFDDTEVRLRTLESSIDSRGRGQLSTELAISAEEFSGYEMAATPVTLAFHLREFTATIAFADSMSLDLDLRFTDPAAPLFIDIGADFAEMLFVVSTSQVHGAPQLSQVSNRGSNPRKRELADARDSPARIKKPMKAAQVTHIEARSTRTQTTSRSSSRVPGSMPPPTAARNTPDRWLPTYGNAENDRAPEPLFLPSSQASVVHDDALRALGMESLDEQQLVDMLDNEGEEVDFSWASQCRHTGTSGSEGRDDDVEMRDSRTNLVDETDFVLTQNPDTAKAFQPLFQD